jgi:hypothetical protein
MFPSYCLSDFVCSVGFGVHFSNMHICYLRKTLTFRKVISLPILINN